MRKKVDLTKKIVRETTIVRNRTTITPRPFYYRNIIKETTVESEETNEALSEEQNKEEKDNENNDDSTNKPEENNNKEDNNSEENPAEQNENSNGTPKSNIENAKEKAKDIKNKIDKAGKNIKKAQKIFSIITNPIFWIVLAAIIGVLGLVLLIAIISGYSSYGSIGFGGYYTSKCTEMTVIFVDKNNGYAVTGSQTYSMEDYVAGVVAAEVGGFANKEVYKVYALAARTFGLTASSDDCTIEGSARRQAFKDITNESGGNYDLIYEAVRETEGQVLLSNGELYRLQYDAFCYIDKDSNYYTLSQKNQKIPVDWAEKNVWSKYYLNCPCDLKDPNMTECWNGNTWEDGGHGRGMSQYGAYYLATQEGYTYDEILSYYYGDDEVTISSNSFSGGVEGITSIAGLEIKDTTKAKPLQQPITEFLSSNGSSLDNMNSFIHESVVEQGAGTRAGVVAAAVSTINYLYDNFNVKLPYYWGGKVYSGAIPSSFGKYSPSAVSRGGNVDYYKSFDCSGFVSWSIRNGGYNFKEQSTSGFDSNYSKNSCLISDSSCIGQPGDLINSRACHVELIIAVDQENGKYFIAHSGGPGVVMQERDMHKGNSSNPTKIIFMEEFYSNPMNINYGY